MIRTFIKHASLLCLAGVLLTGCGKTNWRTDNVAGELPKLKFTLTDQTGRIVHANDFRGKIKLLYFGYTHCPDVCPLSLATIAQALHKLHGEADRVRVLFVSVDPKRDTPKALRRYTRAFGSQFVGLTGTQSHLKALAKRYGAAYSYAKSTKNGNYVVNHSASIYVFDRDGHVRLLMNRTDGAAAMAHDLKQLLD
jgi:protein SCO1/2